MRGRAKKAPAARAVSPVVVRSDYPCPAEAAGSLEQKRVPVIEITAGLNLPASGFSVAAAKDIDLNRKGRVDEAIAERLRLARQKIRAEAGKAGGELLLPAAMICYQRGGIELSGAPGRPV